MKLKQFGPLVREEIVPGINVVWVFTPEDIEEVFKNEGRYPERRSHLAILKYREERPEIYNTGGLLPTYVFYTYILAVMYSSVNDNSEYLNWSNIALGETESIVLYVKESKIR